MIRTKKIFLFNLDLSLYFDLFLPKIYIVYILHSKKLLIGFKKNRCFYIGNDVKLRFFRLFGIQKNLFNFN